MSPERLRGTQAPHPGVGGGEKSKKVRTRKTGKRDDVIRLEDLVPRRDVTGGAAKLLFGERVESRDGREPTGETRNI